MSHDPPPPDTCRRTGLVMTCYEDGKKRYRTALLAQELPDAAQETAAAARPSETESPAVQRRD